VRQFSILLRITGQEGAMGSSSRRRGYVLCVTLALAVLPSPLFADGPQVQAPVSLAELVTAGDVVIVTLWAGGKFKAAVVGATACGLVLRTEALTWTVQLPEIKTLRRHETRPENPGTKVMLEIASSCEQPECALGALFYVGVGAAIQGLDELSHPPKVVYRASRRQTGVGTCSSQTAVSARRNEFPGLR
jgi:hypothetical protein